MTAHEPVVVIGAGPAGLAASAALRREGVAHVVLEREASVASAWRRHYARLHLHTVKRHSALPYTPWDAAVPKYPSRAQVVEYFEHYARTHEVRPRFGVDVQRVARVPGGGLVVQSDQGEWKARAVVVATGYNRVPFVPALPGADAFAGTAIHSSAYREASPFAGKRTLVMGCGNSGAEIALDLAEHGVDVAMVVRGPVHVVPRDMLGRPSQETGILLSRLPLGVRDAIVSGVMRLAVGDLSRWGIVRPTMGLNAMIEQLGRVPILDIGTIAKVKQGRIRVVPDVRAVQPGGVVLADGRELPFDAIIYATGFRTGLHALIEGFDTIADGRGRPHRFGEETGVPGLYFVGYRNPTTGALREIALEAPRVAKAIRARMVESRA